MNRGLIALVVLAAGALWLMRTPREPEATQMATPELTSVAAPKPAAADLPPPNRSSAPTPDQLALPDGTFVPALNGTRGAPPLQAFWGNRPWSPIVRVERSDLGIDWYVHADGTHSTTEMKWRSDLGRLDAMTRVAQPVERAPSPATDR